MTRAIGSRRPVRHGFVGAGRAVPVVIESPQNAQGTERRASTSSSRHRECKRPRPSGFTLLEVMIALLIVSVSIVAVAGINASSMSMHVYSKQLTVATLLARGKMADIEQALQADGLPTDDETEDGDFSEEGFPKIKWRAEILRPKTEDIQIANLLQSVGLDGSSEGPLGGFLDSQLLTNSEFFAGSSAGSGITTDIGSLLSAGGGLVSGMLTSQLQTMVDNLGNTVREVRLTVSWGEEKKGSARDSFSIATHVVSLGQGTDQRQSDAVAQGLDKAMNSAGTTSGVNVNTSGTSSSSTSGSHSSSSSSSGGNR